MLSWLKKGLARRIMLATALLELALCIVLTI